MLNPMRDKNWRHVPGERRDDTCEHGLSRRSLRVKPPCDDQKKKRRSMYVRSTGIPPPLQQIPRTSYYMFSGVLSKCALTVDSWQIVWALIRWFHHYYLVYHNWYKNTRSVRFFGWICLFFKGFILRSTNTFVYYLVPGMLVLIITILIYIFTV